jgi:hypothetical protein
MRALILLVGVVLCWAIAGFVMWFLFLSIESVLRGFA